MPLFPLLLSNISPIYRCSQLKHIKNKTKKTNKNYSQVTLFPVLLSNVSPMLSTYSQYLYTCIAQPSYSVQRLKLIKNSEKLDRCTDKILQTLESKGAKTKLYFGSSARAFIFGIKGCERE